MKKEVNADYVQGDINLTEGNSKIVAQLVREVLVLTNLIREKRRECKDLRDRIQTLEAQIKDNGGGTS